MYAAPCSSCRTECTANPVKSSFRFNLVVSCSSSSLSASTVPWPADEAGAVADEAGADLSFCWRAFD